LRAVTCLLVTVLLIGTVASLNITPVNVVGVDSLLSVDWTHYHNYTEIADILLQLNLNYPDVVDVFSIGKSYLGKDIYCVRLTNETHAGLKSRVLFVGYHHARERITAELLLRFVVDTVTVWGSNQTINAMLNDAEIFVIVALNVDGFEAVEKNEWQRRNLRPLDEDNDGLFDEDPPDDVDGDGYIEDLVRLTDNGWEFVRWEGVDDDGDGLLNEDWAGGVDLNRNYGYMWNATVDFPGTNPSEEDYRGPEPFSENETQVMRDFALQHPFQYAISFHSGGEWVARPWMYTLEPPEDDKVFKEVGGNISSLVGIPFPYSDVRSTVSGVWDDWMYGNRSVIALTCEIYRNLSALSYTYAGEDELYWERGITQMFNPAPTGIETVLHRWLPVFTYVTNRAINDTLELSLSDLNKDGTIDIFDIVIIAVAFGSEPADPNWNIIADINNDGIVDIFDLVVVALHFAETI
jgi:hypothetical protein